MIDRLKLSPQHVLLIQCRFGSKNVHRKAELRVLRIRAPSRDLGVHAPELVKVTRLSQGSKASERRKHKCEEIGIVFLIFLSLTSSGYSVLDHYLDPTVR
jgi:hypothetical protein